MVVGTCFAWRRKIWAEVWWTWAAVRHGDEIELRGQCPCGCGQWAIQFRDRYVLVTEEAYDSLRWLLAHLR